MVENALYIVATPIGNLSDISYRAIEVLKNSDIILAEDTRTTSILLEKYQILTKTVSYHKFNETARIEPFINYLKEGKTLSLVSDAGTPLISDPGNILVKEARKNNIKIIPIPGCSAVTALLSSVEREDEDFKFIGFLPKTKQKIEEITEKNKHENLIFYESPKRLVSTLEIIIESDSNRIITIGRELTKKFEEIKKDSIKNLLNHYTLNPPKGEIAVLLHKISLEKNSSSINEAGLDIDEKIRKLKKSNFKDKEISTILSALYDINKNIIYKKCIESGNH